MILAGILTKRKYANCSYDTITLVVPLLYIGCYYIISVVSFAQIFYDEDISLIFDSIDKINTTITFAFIFYA